MTEIYEDQTARLPLHCPTPSCVVPYLGNFTVIWPKLKNHRIPYYGFWHEVEQDPDSC